MKIKYLIRKIINKIGKLLFKEKINFLSMFLIAVIKKDQQHGKIIILDKIEDGLIKLWYFFTSDIGRSLYLNGNFEHETTIFLKKIIKSGDIILDIGANIGQFSVIMSMFSGSSGKIYAIEPYDKNISLIKKNIEINDIVNIYVHKVAIADKNGRMIFRIYDDYAYNSFLLIDRKKLLKEDSVECQTIDAFIEQNKITKLDLIKIDIEGYELPAMKGAENTLNKFRPGIIAEIQPLNLKSIGLGWRDIIDYLAAKDYEAFVITDDGLKNIDEELDARYENYYFKPKQ